MSRVASSIYNNNGTYVEKANLQLGDLVFFASNSSSIGHVGIYIGNGEVVQAANTKAGVIRNKLEDTAWTHWLKIPYISYIEETEENQNA